LLCYGHRYDYIFPGKFQFKNGKIIRIKNGESVLVLPTYGSLSGEQTNKLIK